jgi:hypothetical protein
LGCNGKYWEFYKRLIKIRRQVDPSIEPLLIERDNDKAGFFEEIRKNGIEIV